MIFSLGVGSPEGDDCEPKVLAAAASRIAGSEMTSQDAPKKLSSVADGDSVGVRDRLCFVSRVTIVELPLGLHPSEVGQTFLRTSTGLPQRCS